MGSSRVKVEDAGVNVDEGMAGKLDEGTGVKVDEGMGVKVEEGMGVKVEEGMGIKGSPEIKRVLGDVHGALVYSFEMQLIKATYTILFVT